MKFHVESTGSRRIEEGSPTGVTEVTLQVRGYGTVPEGTQVVRFRPEIDLRGASANDFGDFRNMIQVIVDPDENNHVFFQKQFTITINKDTAIEKDEGFAVYLRSVFLEEAGGSTTAQYFHDSTNPEKMMSREFTIVNDDFPPEAQETADKMTALRERQQELLNPPVEEKNPEGDPSEEAPEEEKKPADEWNEIMDQLKELQDILDRIMDDYFKEQEEAAEEEPAPEEDGETAEPSAENDGMAEDMEDEFFFDDEAALQDENPDQSTQMKDEPDTEILDLDPASHDELSGDMTQELQEEELSAYDQDAEFYF